MHLLLADINWSRTITAAVTAAVVPLLLQYFLKAARKEARVEGGRRLVSYPNELRVFCWGGWCFAVGFGVAGAFFIRDASWAGGLVLFGLFAAMMLPLHLEVSQLKISWDDSYIYACSAWRKKRTIPIDSIRRCDYSKSAQWYRLYSTSHGIVRIHQFCRGVGELLDALPDDVTGKLPSDCSPTA